MVNAYRDWLGELQAALATGTVLGAAGGVAAVAHAAFAGSVDLTVPTGHAAALADVRAGVTLAETGVLDVTIADPAWADRAVAALDHAPAYLLGLVIVAVLWRIVRAARRADPFSPDLARRMRRLGLFTLVGGLIGSVSQWGIGVLASTRVYDGYFAAVMSIDLWWFLLGFGLLAVAEVLYRGAALRAELDEVV